MEQNSKNLIGAQVRRLRNQLGLSQDMLAARCNVVGWDLSRGTLAKIEAGLRCVTDQEAAILALALRVSLLALYPAPWAARLRKVSFPASSD